MSRPKGSFSVGKFRVTTRDVAAAPAVDDDNLKAAFRRLSIQLRERHPLPEALEASCTEEQHPWITALFAIAHEWLSDATAIYKPIDGVVDTILVREFGEDVDAVLQELVKKFLMHLKEHIVANYFCIGTQWAHHDSVCEALEPTNIEVARCWWTLGTCIASGVPILDGLQLSGNVASHPWLVMLFASAHSAVREGESLATAIATEIDAFQKKRVERAMTLHPPTAADEADNQPQAPTSGTRGGGYRVHKLERVVPQDVPPESEGTPFELLARERLRSNRRTKNGDWLLPNLRGFFEREIHLIDVGEETGALDEVLYGMTQMRYPSATQQSFPSKPWGQDVELLLRSLAALQNAGMPILRSLRILENSPAHQNLQAELASVIQEIECGGTISEAMAQVQGQLGDRLLVNLIRAGECSGALEVVLSRIVS